jgi:glycosyltransferase involved in cell wall biosynthesis
LKVVINAVSAKLGGGATYISNLLRHVSLLARDSQFLVFLPPETIETLHSLPDNIRLVPTRVGYGRWWERMWWEQVTLRRVLRNEKPDILFSAANFGMLQCPVPQVLLLQNALYFSSAFQELFFPKCSLRRRAGFLLRRWLVCESLRGADLVIIPTQAALDDLRRFVQVPQAKALVNPYGGKIPAAGADPARGGHGAHRLGESGPVRLLYVSLYFEHKNLTTLLKAMPVLNSQGSPKFKLATTLDPASEVHASWTITGPTDLALAGRSDIRDSLEVVGLLGQAETQELYGQADIFVFPSLAESFGFPMVEAMAHGLPIVAADTPVNREICQDAAVYFSPLDCDDLAAKIRRVATDDVLRSKLSAAGPPRVATCFRWNEHVGRILESFRRVLAESTAGTPKPWSGTQAGRRL